MLRDLRYAREHCGPIGMWVWAIWRFGRRYGERGVGRLAYLLLDLLVVRIVASARVPRGVTIGERVGFVHDAQGVVLHPGVVIGDDCTIYHQVTIGHVWGKPGEPRIGSGVLIGAGAKVLGPITVGDGAAIGANAVVVEDVPAGTTVVGSPARVVRQGPADRIRR